MLNNVSIDETVKHAEDLLHGGWVCAAACLQGLREALDLRSEVIPWVAAGYWGAIASGQTICGAIYGATAAIGFACGEKMAERSETERQARDRATTMTREFYQRFLKEFNRLDCRSLTGCDFGRPEEVKRYFGKQVWTDTCDKYLEFAIRTCYELEQEQKEKGVEKAENACKVTNRVLGRTREVVAGSASEACEKLGWKREDCDVERVVEA
jgi:C_GCAxxG_C_C family probable redox protein